MELTVLGFGPWLDPKPWVVILIPGIFNTPNLNPHLLSGTLPVHFALGRCLARGLVLFRPDVGQVALFDWRVHGEARFE